MGKIFIEKIELDYEEVKRNSDYITYKTNSGIEFTLNKEIDEENMYKYGDTAFVFDSLKIEKTRLNENGFFIVPIPVYNCDYTSLYAFEFPSVSGDLKTYSEENERLNGLLKDSKIEIKNLREMLEKQEEKHDFLLKNSAANEMLEDLSEKFELKRRQYLETLNYAAELKGELEKAKLIIMRLIGYVPQFNNIDISREIEKRLNNQDWEDQNNELGYPGDPQDE